MAVINSEKTKKILNSTVKNKLIILHMHFAQLDDIIRRPLMKRLYNVQETAQITGLDHRKCIVVKPRR